MLAALVRYGRFFGDRLTIEYPTGSGQKLTLEEIADDVRRRLISIFRARRDLILQAHGKKWPTLYELMLESAEAERSVRVAASSTSAPASSTTP